MVHYWEKDHNETACTTVLLPALGWEDVITTNVDEVDCPNCVYILAVRVSEALTCRHRRSIMRGLDKCIDCGRVISPWL